VPLNALRVSKYSVGAALGLLSILTSQVLCAQSVSSTTAAPATADSGTALEEIVITAQRRSESLREVPIAVTVVTAQQMANFDIKTTDGLQLLTPNLTFDTSKMYAASYIRGIGSASTNPGLEGAVATYIDGAYLERSFGTVFDLLDPGSVQVLKGPQGTLYGRNATGGAILITTADPTDKEEVRVAAEGGTEGHALGEIIANIPLSETLAMRVAAREDHDGGYINDLYNGRKFGTRTTGQARVKLRWAPSEGFSAVLGVDHTDTSNNLGGATQERFPAPICSACALPNSGAPQPGFFNTDVDTMSPFLTEATSANLRLNYTTGIYQFTSVSGYRHDANAGLIDLDLTALPLFDYNEHQGGTTYSEDLQLATNSAGWVNGLVAASYFHDQSSISAGFLGDSFTALQEATGELPLTDNQVTTKSEAILAEIYLTPIGHLKITAGARYTHDDRTLGVNTNLAGLLANGFSPTLPLAFAQNASFDSTTPRFVVAYDFDAVNVYASFNRGFKAGGFNTATFVEQPVIKPEKIDSYEIGAKFVSEDRRVQANVAAFHYKYSDIQVAIVDLAAGGSEVQNAASAKGDGGEADVAYNATRWLELIGGVSYLDAKFTSYPNASVNVYPSGSGIAAGTENLSGFPLPRSPRFTGYLGANLSADVGRDWVGHLSVIAHHSSRYDFYPGAGGPLGYDYQPAYTLANLTASIGPSDEKYRISLYVKNLTDAKYYVERQTTAPFGIFDVVSRPITGGLRIDYRF
jgi:iron complex outermembrane recepter protein